MRRALIAFLILSMLGGQVGMLGALLLGRHRARQHMQRRVAAVSESVGETAALQHLIIPRTEQKQPGSSFMRINDHEFRYRGKLYDIVREERRGTVWHVWALHDHEEEHYLKALAQTLDAPMLFAQPTRPTHELLHAYRKLALVPRASIPSLAMRSRSFPPVLSTEPQPPYLEVPHPPPWG